MTPQDIKPGYKQSPLGLIPNDWNSLCLKNVVDILDNKRKPLNSDERKDMAGDIPYYGANGVVDYINEYLIDDDLILIAEDGGNFGDYATKPIAYKISGKAWINNHVHVLKAKENYNQDYVFYSLEHKNILLQLNGGTRSKLNRSELEKITISIPPLPEQEAIAKILGKVDETIEKTQKMIEKLELRNKGLERKLLTGKIRLKGFEGQRNRKKIGDEIIFYGKKSTKNNEYEVLTSSKSGLMSQKEYYGEGRLVMRDNVGFNIIPSGYITYRSRSDDGIFTFNINKYDFTGIVSKYYPVFTCKSGSNIFLTKILNLFAQKIGCFAIGTSQLVLGIKELSNIYLDLPSEKEQKAIVDILNCTNNQVETYKQKLEKLQELKRGLMQQLLTGKVRVKEFNN